ncbi:MAG: L-threonylcarbamoyladenylate synthase [Burkholderiaceae bacterium]
MLLDGRDPAAIEQAAQLLAAGELLAFPTETVYGLGARADDDAAVARIFAAKERPADHPLIVHVAQADDVHAFATHVPARARRLIDAFWPGPMTIIVLRTPGVADAAAGGHATLGLRCPAHPVAQNLLAACRRLGVPGVAAPSANRFGRISPTRAAHVGAEFVDRLASLVVLDGCDCAVGIESSIVDCSGSHAVLLRPGIVPRTRIEAVLGEPVIDADESAPRAPGTLAAHYAPQAKLRVMPAAMIEAALQVLGAPPLHLAVYSRSLPASAALGFIHRRMPLLPEAAAHELYASLREFDAQGAQLIWVEEPPASPEWDGVRDRLQRAAAAI